MLAKDLIAALLGLSAEWQIRDISVTPPQHRIDVHVERAQGSALDRFFKRRQDTIEHRWQGPPLAGYSCFLHVHVPPGETVQPEAWMGENGRPFTRDFAQRLRIVNTALRTGDERTLFEQAFRVAVTDLRRQDIQPGMAAARGPTLPERAPAPVATIPSGPRLPGAEHMVWRHLAMGDIAIDIRSLPLKLLLTRVRMQVKQDPRVLPDATAELHRFFCDRARLLGHELIQIGRFEGRTT